MDEIVREFLVESYENLDQLDQDLVELEKSPGDRALLSSIFRTIHTIKGTSGFLAFGRLERLTHVGENLLVELRDGRRAMDESSTTTLLLMVDAVREILASIDATGAEGDVAVDPVIERIRAVLENRHPTPAAAPLTADAPADGTNGALTDGTDGALTDGTDQAADHAASAFAFLAADDDVAFVPEVASPVEPAGLPTRGARALPVRTPRPEPTASTPSPSPEPIPAPPDPSPPATPGPADASASADPTSPADPTSADPTSADPTSPADPTSAARGSHETSVRVDVDLLDALMRQVGELVLARNQLKLLAAEAQDPALTRAFQRLSVIAGELQDGVMKTRMQPIYQVWGKVPRLVRDLAAVTGRKVRLDMIGGETELDRTLLEAVKDPLTHLIRNAVDHGIEDTDVRVAAGKNQVGVVTLRASHAGGQVVVEVTDDGGGIDPGRVAAKAVERGLRTVEQVAAMSVPELLHLLFLPGFSTAQAVTNVSGRGVGMDVVRTKVEAIGGSVDVESTVGAGTTWRLRIPLTLAIVPALMLEAAGGTYAIGQVGLQELVAVEAEKVATVIEHIGSAPVYRLRGDLLPLVGLRDVLGHGSFRDTDGSLIIAVLESDSHRFGLVVDRVLTTEEVVVKPLPARLKAIGLYAGATLLGDGRVALILDGPSIARHALAADAADLEEAVIEEEVDHRETEEMLVAGVGGGHRVAFPLALVTRLERLRGVDVEHVGGREVIQYRGAIVPLLRLQRLVGVEEERAGGELLVVVASRGSRTVAITVDEILDITHDDVAARSLVDAPGLLGSSVLNGRVTGLLDWHAALLSADAGYFDEVLDEPGAESARTADLVGV
ncbi:chemotaxis protein CheA [Cellulomonas fimi]|nr:chemotaxis protein CheA [Cellulomonas fimi]